jgi:glycine/D-amino acid oxidase-like deaminating enzyme
MATGNLLRSSTMTTEELVEQALRQLPRDRDRLAEGVSRRHFIKSAGISLVAASVLSRTRFAWAGDAPMLPVPTISAENIIRFTACIRPHRTGRIRMELESIGDKSIFHHYGHGGAGITLSWGTAEALVDQLERVTPKDHEIAVAGAGIVGLSTARVLSERGYEVAIYSKDFWPNTTSSTAGGQWCPAGVAWGTTDEEAAQLVEMLRRSYRRYETLVGPEYGVYRRINYVEGNAQEVYKKLPPDLIEPLALDSLPFPGSPRSGAQFRSFLIEPSTYLPQLSRDLLSRGVRFHPAVEFRSISDLLALPQDTLVNCMGIGSKAVFDDPALIPYRGQLVHLRPQPECEWLLVHQHGYVFPRHDAVVLGGTYEEGVADPTPDPTACMKILESNKAFFS